MFDVTELIDALEAIQAMPADPEALLPHVPDEVLPAQVIYDLLNDWLERVEEWSEMLQGVDRYVDRLVAIPPTAAPERVIGL